MKLTAENVEAIFYECLCDENTKSATQPYKGVLNTASFDLAALRKRHGDIEDLLDELPDGFHADKGGGWSFLQACMDREGNQWGLQRNVDAGRGVRMMAGCEKPSSSSSENVCLAGARES